MADDAQEEFLLEYDEAKEESAETNISQEDFSSLIISPSDWTVQTLFTQIGKQIDLDPAFQRRNVWSSSAKSSFIESLFLGIPIPQILLSARQSSKSTFLVLDGKQRLLTIKEFLSGQHYNGRPFKLTGLRVVKALEGKTWEQISQDEDWKFRLLNETLRTAVIRGWKNEQVLYEIFYRLNSGSVKLSPMELRMSLHPGEFLKFIILWTETMGPIHQLLRRSSPDPRMADVELAVRFLSFSDSNIVYQGDLKKALDQLCTQYNTQFVADADAKDRVVERLTVMNEAISAGLICFGEKFFCRKFLEGQYETRFNRAIFDIQVGSLRFSFVRDFANEHPDQMRRLFEDLSHDNDFVRSLETTTKSVAATKERFGKWYAAVGRLVGRELEIPRIENAFAN